MVNYNLYLYCRFCGAMISEEEHDDNNGLCDDCWMDKQTWEEVPFGCDSY